MSYYNSSNSEIIDGRIFNSIVDMNLRPIVNVLDPTNPQDAATKFYVDRNTALNYDIILKGTDFVFITSPAWGAYTLKIESETEGFPCGIFSAVKSHRSRKGICKAFDDFDLSDSTRLLIEWDENENIKIRKTGVECDGNYNIRLLR